MPKQKTNRKGYFVQHLRAQGINQQQTIARHKRKGVRKQAKVTAREARERKKIYLSHMQQRVSQLVMQIQKLKSQITLLRHQKQRVSKLAQKLAMASKLQISHIQQSALSVPAVPMPVSKNSQQKSNSNNSSASALMGLSSASKLSSHTYPNPSVPSALMMLTSSQMMSSATKSMRFQGLFKQIKNLSISLETNNNEQISRSLSVLRDKFGISGRQRLKSIDQMFDKLVNIIMPMHYRLLMQHCMQTRQFYSLLNTSNSPTKNLKIKLEQKTKQTLINIRPQIIKQREQYDRLLTNLLELRTKIKVQNCKCQSIVDQIQDGIHPTFVGRLLLDLDFCRGKDNIQNIYPVNYWNRCEDDGLQLVIPPKKKQISVYNQANYICSYGMNTIGAGHSNNCNNINLNNNINIAFQNVDENNYKDCYKFDDDLDIINQLFF